MKCFNCKKLNVFYNANSDGNWVICKAGHWEDVVGPTEDDPTEEDPWEDCKDYEPTLSARNEPFGKGLFDLDLLDKLNNH